MILDLFFKDIKYQNLKKGQQKVHQNTPFGLVDQNSLSVFLRPVYFGLVDYHGSTGRLEKTALQLADGRSLAGPGGGWLVGAM